MQLIGLTGPKGVGKSTLARRMEQDSPVFLRLSFATPLKAMLTAGFGLDFEKLTPEEKESPIPGINLTPRLLMQTLGTEWGRKLDEELWIKLMRLKLQSLPWYSRVVIDDVRFDNEARLVREFGGLVLRLSRDGFEPSKDSHISEAGVSSSLVDGYFPVNGWR